LTVVMDTPATAATSLLVSRQSAALTIFSGDHGEHGLLGQREPGRDLQRQGSRGGLTMVGMLQLEQE
jgi:hypothetical protein